MPLQIFSLDFCFHKFHFSFVAVLGHHNFGYYCVMALTPIVMLVKLKVTPILLRNRLDALSSRFRLPFAQMSDDAAVYSSSFGWSQK